MRISKKTDTRCRALFTLVDHYGGQPIPSVNLLGATMCPNGFLNKLCSGQVAGLGGQLGGNSRRLFSGAQPAKITLARWCGILMESLRPLTAFRSRLPALLAGIGLPVPPRFF